jgi:uncharacterized membrane protein YdfJ with MMPL/SSD domain
MIRNHVRHIHNTIDNRSLPIRGVITVVALLSLPLVGTAVRTLGSVLNLGRLVLPLLVLAHIPAVIALIAVWSIGCDICRTEGTA